LERDKRKIKTKVCWFNRWLFIVWRRKRRPNVW